MASNEIMWNDCVSEGMWKDMVLTCLIRTPGFDLELSVTKRKYEGWNFNSGNYLFTTDTK